MTQPAPTSRPLPSFPSRRPVQDNIPPTRVQRDELYRVAETSVHVSRLDRALAVKVTLPRPGASSGAPGDRDVYGSQQHFPLADLDV